MPGGAGTAWLVLLLVFAGGLFAGVAKKGRWGLLGSGLLLILVVALLVAQVWTVRTSTSPDVLAAQLTGVYAVVLPPLVAFLAGWMVARGRWLWRGVVVALAVFVLAFLPYAALGTATADALTGTTTAPVGVRLL